MYIVQVKIISVKYLVEMSYYYKKVIVEGRGYCNVYLSVYLFSVEVTKIIIMMRWIIRWYLICWYVA